MSNTEKLPHIVRTINIIAEGEDMPFDHMFNGELCHATGMLTIWSDGEQWYEYESNDGTLYYGR